MAGSESTVLQLQRELYRQVTGGPLSESKGDEKENLATMRRQVRRKSALLVLDDLWQSAQYEALQIFEGLDTTGHAGSSSGLRQKLLITSRLRDVVPHATTVDVSVMSEDEAAQLLMRTAGMEESVVTSPPPEAFDIARECGYLPLSLAIAGRIIFNVSGFSVQPICVVATVYDSLVHLDLSTTSTGTVGRIRYISFSPQSTARSCGGRLWKWHSPAILPVAQAMVPASTLRIASSE